MQFVEESFKDRDHAMIWMLDQQSGRRNSTPEQKRFLVGVRYNLEKKVEKFKGNQHTSGIPQTEEHQPSHTAVRMAAENNCSRATIERSANYAAGVALIVSQSKDPEKTKADILPGKDSRSMTEIQEIGRGSRVDPDMAKMLVNPNVVMGEPKPKEKKTVVP